MNIFKPHSLYSNENYFMIKGLKTNKLENTNDFFAVYSDKNVLYICDVPNGVVAR